MSIGRHLFTSIQQLNSTKTGLNQLQLSIKEVFCGRPEMSVNLGFPCWTLFYQNWLSQMSIYALKNVFVEEIRRLLVLVRKYWKISFFIWAWSCRNLKPEVMWRAVYFVWFILHKWVCYLCSCNEEAEHLRIYEDLISSRAKPTHFSV